MRPERLELEGFTAFRRRVAVDFRNADLFALTGPTGAGKSSLIDAMVFALYGSVPRHGKRDVAPVVTQGLLEAKVRLDFTVGEVGYTVVRVVRKTGSRANTDEARLQRGEQVLASSAREVDEAVAALIGLDFDQFTTCVVLPQGDFERFLHAKPAERQGLLVALLDLGIYDRVAQLAVSRQRLAEGRRTEIDAQLEALTGLDEKRRTHESQRLDALVVVLEELDTAEPRLEELRRRGAEARAALDQARRRVERLGSVTAPSGFSELATNLTVARQAVVAAEESVAKAEEDRRSAELGRGVRTVAEIERLLQRRAVLGETQRRHAGLVAELEAAEKTAESAAEHAVATRRLLEEARLHDAAGHLRSALAVGDLCPVCGNRIEALPDRREVGASARLEADADGAATASREAENTRSVLRTRTEETESALAALRHELADVEDEAGLEESVARARLAEQEVVRADSALTKARADLTASRAALAELAEGERNAARALTAARDAVADLNPPVLDLDDVAAAWRLLEAWVAERRPQVEAEAVGASEERDRLAAEWSTLDTGLRQKVATVGVEAGERPRDALVEAVATARSTLADIDAALERKRSLSEERTTRHDEASVAKDLAMHLRANNFEKWLLDEALRVLADGANRRLDGLASGQYSLVLSDRLEFEVVDHHAADERRPVRSLSGGETFLVSLALALSLADQVSEMAASGAAHLESIFLDEGFGTLDAETLDTVAAVISEIGATGKTVGLITHVKELAEQVPVRFEVSKTPDGATVRRVDT